MADADFDIDALLEEPINRKKEADKDRERSSVSLERRDDGDRDESGGRHRSRSRSPKERSSRDRRRSRSRERDSRSSRRSRSRDRDSRRRSRSRDRDRGDRGGSRRRSRSRERRRSRSRERRGRRSRSRSPGARGGGGGSGGRSRRRSGGGGGGGGFGRYRGRSRSKSKSPDPLLTPEERDARTIFIMQLSQRVRSRDVEEFFSAVGKIRDVKLIVCNKTRRFKGIAYVEFKDIESVPLALGLNGQKLLGVPVIVQPSQAEKNRIAGSYADMGRGRDKGPMRLYVGSLHFNITEEMLKGIFEPFGKIQSIQLIMDTETNRSKGYGFVTYCEAEDAKKALEQMNGFELAGRPMKVGHVTERSDATLVPMPHHHHHHQMPHQGLDSEEMDKTGIDLGATGRLQLMAKLAEGTGMKLPDAASQALNTAAMASQMPPQPTVHQQAIQQQQQLAMTNPPIATQCFLLSNMFNPEQETNPGWEADVRDDVIDECAKYGGVQHIYVDTASPSGNVYVKCPTTQVAVSAVNALHGRWFAGKVITAAYVPVSNYVNLFPDSASSLDLLTTNR